jgi:hypothetical protein
MRAGKLITLSAVAVLVGGTSLATDLAIGQTQQGGSSMQGGSLNKGSAPKGSPRSQIPRVSSVGTAVRIDAVVPRSVRQAAVPLPPEVQRMEPRFPTTASSSIAIRS